MATYCAIFQVVEVGLTLIESRISAKYVSTLGLFFALGSQYCFTNELKSSVACRNIFLLSSAIPPMSVVNQLCIGFRKLFDGFRESFIYQHRIIIATFMWTVSCVDTHNNFGLLWSILCVKLKPLKVQSN